MIPDDVHLGRFPRIHCLELCLESKTGWQQGMRLAFDLRQRLECLCGLSGTLFDKERAHLKTPSVSEPAYPPTIWTQHYRLAQHFRTHLAHSPSCIWHLKPNWTKRGKVSWVLKKSVEAVERSVGTLPAMQRMLGDLEDVSHSKRISESTNRQSLHYHLWNSG